MYLAALVSAVGAPPELFALAGHPLRWRLLSELAHSDRRVRELCSGLGERQNLVSYHLRRLRSAGMVSTRRSSHDARDVYYGLDLRRCNELLAESGAALHPGLGPSARAEPPRRHRRPVRVLFLCTGNSSRSQIAEAVAQELGGGTIEAFSAGSNPKALHPNAIAVMQERGIDISGREAKNLSVFSRQRFDYVISLCDRVREVCPEFRGDPETIHWSIPDPAAEPYPAFERTAAELETRIRFLLRQIDERPREVSR